MTPHIHSDPNILMGKPVIAGTRLSVELILNHLAAGETIEQLLESYPRLTRPAICAALEFAAQVLQNDVLYPVTMPFTPEIQTKDSQDGEFTLDIPLDDEKAK